MAPDLADGLIVIGIICSTHGIRGEVKVRSFTNTTESLLGYKKLTLRRGKDMRQVELVSGHSRNGRLLVVKLRGLDDCDEAGLLRGFEICISHNLLPDLADGEYYWYQLQGLRVINLEGQLFGKIAALIETGSNDVMEVIHCPGSLDDRDRLLPYTEQCVLNIDLEAGEMKVDWNAAF